MRAVPAAMHPAPERLVLRPSRLYQRVQSVPSGSGFQVGQPLWGAPPPTPHATGHRWFQLGLGLARLARPPPRARRLLRLLLAMGWRSERAASSPGSRRVVQLPAADSP